MLSLLLGKGPLFVPLMAFRFVACTLAFFFVVIFLKHYIRRRLDLKFGSKTKKTKLKIAFVHPDLGIGGAENLVVNAGLALLQQQHQVFFYTSHHDPSHCFPETTADGILADSIAVHGDFLPRTIYKKMAAFCALVRMVYLSIVVALFHANNIDVFFVDQISIAVPILRLTGIPVIFYCHFPDKLLCTERSSLLKQIYRIPLDAIEEFSTSFANLLLVNSNFTASIFRESFPDLKNCALNILYPPINLEDFTSLTDNLCSVDDKHIFVSINRFERKKNLAMAIEALSGLKSLVDSKTFSKVELIIAGGYDPQNLENIEHFEELKEIVNKFELSSQVKFLTSVSNEKKKELFHSAKAVVYTPSKEHFGIVPVEAMACGTAVIAVNDGGPKESILNNRTGFLCENTASSFADAMKKIILNSQTEDYVSREEMGKLGKERAAELFSLDAFSKNLDGFIQELVQNSLKTD